MLQRIVIVLLIFFVGNLSSSFAQRKVTLCNDPWPPFTKGENGFAPTGGLAVEIQKEIFKRMEGVELELILFPWKRCLKEVKEGNIDGIIIGLKSSKRPYLVYPDELFPQRIVFFYSIETHPDGIVWENLEDLSDYWIGVLGGSTYTNEFSNAVKDGILKVDASKTAALAIKKLAKGRVDLVVSNESVANEIIKAEGFGDILRVAEKPLRTRPYYMAFGDKSSATDLIPQVNKAIAAIKSDGTMKRILGN